MYKNIEYCKEENIAIYKLEFKEFEENTPEEYKIAAKEGVNNKKERLIRDEYVRNILKKGE